MFVHLWLAVQTSGLATPYAQHQPLAIHSVEGAPKCPKLSIEELKVDLGATYQNPFDPAEVTLDAEVAGPGGAHYEIPGFLYQDYSRALHDETEALAPKGVPGWRIRLTPTQVGRYRVVVKLKDSSGSVSKSFEFDSTESDAFGFPKESDDSRYFVNSDSSSIFPIGVNLFTAGPKGTFDYDDWLGKASQNGINLQRVLLNSSDATFAMEKQGRPEDGLGPGQFNLVDAWKLDHVLDVARQARIYTILALDQSKELSIRANKADWDHNVLNQDNGGPLRVWTDFWTNPKADKIYKNRLRYLVARYSADPKVFAWEMWRDVDQVQEYDPTVVRPWHSRMVSTLKELDPYDHLVTTSFAFPNADRDTFLLKGIDFAEMHAYSPRPVGILADQITRRGEWGKPTLVTEVGIDRDKPYAAEDPIGAQVHDPLWVSLVTGSAGSAMPWWGDQLVDRNGLYPLIGVMAKFCAGVDFAKEGFRPGDADLAFVSDKEAVPNGDLVLEEGPESWLASSANRPQTVNIMGDHSVGPAPSKILHGVKVYPELHNPLTMIVNEGVDSKLQLDVGKVSLKLGANLRVTVDGVKSLDQPFPPESTGPRVDYQGRFTVPLSKGVHQILIENTGADWMELTYRLAGVIPLKTPPANIWSLVGNGIALAWVQQKGWNWQSAILEKQTFNPIPASNVALSDLASGTWDCEIWDTWKGVVLTKNVVSVGLDGKATVPLPAFTIDLAIKMVRRK